MKNKFKIVLTMMLVLIILPFNDISAADGSVSISGPSELAPGQSATYTISFSADDTAYFQYSISGSNISVSGSGFAPGDGATSTSQVSVTATAGSEGSGSISVNVDIATTGSSPTKFSRSASKNISIAQPVVTPAPSKPKPPTKTPQQIAAEKEAAEQKEKERLQKTPLVQSIEILSMSPKKYNQSVFNVIPEFDTWEFDANLPKRVEKFDLDIRGVDEDVILTFDPSHTFEDSSESVKEIQIRAVKGEITQEYVLRVNKDDSIPLVIELDNAEGTVFDDEELDQLMTESSFTRNTYKNKDDQDIPYFTINNVNVQLIVNSENEASWYLLNEDHTIGDLISIQFDESRNPIFILEAPEDMQQNTLLGKKYELVEGKVDDILINLDASIKWVNNFYAWELDDKYVVYAMDSTAVRDNYSFSEAAIKAAVVSFDQVDNSTKTIAIVSSVGFVAVSGYLLVTTLMNIRKRKNSL